MKELENCTRFTAREFKDSCNSQTIIDSDGHGYYGNDESESKRQVCCKNIRRREWDGQGENDTHVYWYNK